MTAPRILEVEANGEFAQRGAAGGVALEELGDAARCLLFLLPPFPLPLLLFWFNRVVSKLGKEVFANVLGLVVFFLDTDCQIADPVQIRFQVPDVEIFEATVEVGDVVCDPESAFLEEDRGGFVVDMVRGAENAVVEVSRLFIGFDAAGVERVFPFSVFGVFFVVVVVDLFPGLGEEDVGAGYEVAVDLMADFQR